VRSKAATPRGLDRSKSHHAKSNGKDTASNNPANAKPSQWRNKGTPVLQFLRRVTISTRATVAFSQLTVQVSAREDRFARELCLKKRRKTDELWCYGVGNSRGEWDDALNI
jgi:hypothetical protein